MALSAVSAAAAVLITIWCLLTDRAVGIEPPPPATTSTGGIQIEDLGPLPKQIEDTLCISEDGLHVATIMPSGSRQVVYYDGKPGPQFDEIGRWGGRSGPAIRLSKDGSHIAYIARRGGSRLVWCDGKEIPADELGDVSGDEGPGSMRFGEQAANAITFSGDGKHIAYKGRGSDSLWHVVFDGKADPGFDSVDHPILASEGRRYAYVAHSADQQTIVIDGKAGTPSQQEITWLRFSPDGKHYAYLSTSAGKSRMVLDGEPGPEYESIASESAQFTASGRLSYVGTKAGGTAVVVIDGKETQIEPGDQFQFSKDGLHVAYIALTPEGQRAVVDGKPGRSYDTIRDLHFSPDGSRIAYRARTPSGEFAVVDDEESEGFSSVSDITFSENGKRYAYVGNTDKAQVIVVVDGQPSKPYREFESLAFSPDGSRYAYEAEIDFFSKSEVVIDGKAAPPANLVATLEPPFGKGEKVVFRFSPNGKRLAMASMVSGGAKHIVAVDGVPGPTSGWCARFIFSPDSAHFAYVTHEQVRDKSFITVTLDNKIVQSIPASPRGNIELIAQAVEDSRNPLNRGVNPDFFKFREDGNLKFLVTKEDKIYRVSVTPGAAIPLPSSSMSTPPNRRTNVIPRTRNSPPDATGQGRNTSPSPNPPMGSGSERRSTNDVSAEQGAKGAPSGGGTVAASVAEQVVEQLSQGDAESLSALYADTVDYMNSGSITNGAIQAQLQQFFERWPVRQWTIMDPVKVESRGASVQQVTFSVRYDLSNPQTGRHSSGIAEETLTVASDSTGAMKIISQHERTSSSPSRAKSGKTNQRP